MATIAAPSCAVFLATLTTSSGETSGSFSGWSAVSPIALASGLGSTSNSDDADGSGVLRFPSGEQDSSYLLLGILLLCTMMIGAPQPVKAISYRQTALYVWDTKPYPPTTQLAEFVRSHNITELHVAQGAGAVSPDTVAWLTQLKIELPHIRLIALAGGDCDWLLPSSQNIASQWVADKAAPRLFDGFDIDVEPWSCPAWKADQLATTEAYLALLQSAHVAALGRPLYASVTYWLDEVSLPSSFRVDLQTNTLADAVLNTTDGIVVMAYHDTYGRIIQGAQTELTTARSRHKYMRIAITADPIRAADLEAGNTFADNGTLSIDATLDKLNAMPCESWCASDSYAGPIVQAYATWRRL